GPNARMLEQTPHGDPEARPVGLTGPLDSAPFGAEPTSEAPHLGRLARPLDALERDEHSTHVQILRVRRYATLARRPAAYGVALCDGRARPARASHDPPAVQMWLMVSRSEGTRSRSRPRSRMWRARWRPPRPKASARASTSPPKRMPKATRTMSRPIPISVSAVANANSSTSHRAARARSRASGRLALTAAISTACPRKFAASQPTTRISSAESARGSRYISSPVAPGAPGIARAPIPGRAPSRAACVATAAAPRNHASGPRHASVRLERAPRRFDDQPIFRRQRDHPRPEGVEVRQPTVVHAGEQTLAVGAHEHERSSGRARRRHASDQGDVVGPPDPEHLRRRRPREERGHRRQEPARGVRAPVA